ncbi:MAG: FecR family protein [Polyangia bacterium]
MPEPLTPPPRRQPADATRCSRRGALRALTVAAAWPLGLVAPERARAAETVLSLGPATVAALTGGATAQPPAPPRAAPTNPTGPASPPRRALRPGDRIASGEQVRTAAGAQLELTFADGTLLRLGPETAVVLLSEARRGVLLCGRVLVAADRMVGGLGVLTQQAALLPEGTTYLVEVPATPGASATVTVLEGAVCACPVQPAGPSGSAPAPARPGAPTPDRMVLPGEVLALGAAAATPTARDLGGLLKSEPLITGFSRPLPALRTLVDLADQQRRQVLAGRNQRLRREIFWKRPPRPPVKLPDLFDVTVRYRFPD